MKNFVLDRTLTRLRKAHKFINTDSLAPWGEGTKSAFTLAEGGRRPLLNSGARRAAFTPAKGGRRPLLNSGARRAAFTPAKDGRRPLLNSGARHAAFTLAEILITLAVIGIVAVIALPTLMHNIQERTQREQVRTVKYKLTQATDKMKSLDLIGSYYGDDDSATKNFINELKKHYKIIKVCENNELDQCWPAKTIENPNTPGTLVDVKTLTTGEKLSAITIGTKNTKTMGIQTADGISMILAFSPRCDALDPYKTYEWSTQDTKPVTNATTNCVAAIFDINGGKAPNRLGKDVRTLNSLFGYKEYPATYMSKADCEKNKKKYGIKGCYHEQDYWAGAVKKCADIGLHLPDMQTLANAAGARYGRTDIVPHTQIMVNGYTPADGSQGADGDCHNFYKTHDWNGRYANSEIICIGDISTTTVGDDSSAATKLTGYFWSSSEVSATVAELRGIYSVNSSWRPDGRYGTYVPLCVGD